MKDLISEIQFLHGIETYETEWMDFNAILHRQGLQEALHILYIKNLHHIRSAFEVKCPHNYLTDSLKLVVL